MTLGYAPAAGARGSDQRFATNPARLCAPLYDLKTNGGWQLGGGPGHRSWDPPPVPPSAGAIKGGPRVAVAKAKARAEAKTRAKAKGMAKVKRNRPQRD
jgi:hypothetical protein